MRKIYALLLTLTVSTLSFGQVFYSETMGTPSGTTAIATYAGQTAPATFDNTTPILYSGTGSVRSTSASSGYTGASGSGNIFISSTTGVGQYFQIDGLNTLAYATADIQLSFGYLTNSTAIQMVVEQSTNGGTSWTPITFTQNPNTGWNLVTVAGGQIPSSATLSLRFTQPTTAQMRIDDIKLANVSASCTFAFGTGTPACDASTVALDTYTTTIAYTGAGNATYTVMTTGGIVGGDNPTTTAAGNIIITGVTEGTNITVTVTGGTCNMSFPVTAPSCEPINTLPYNEPFNYTVGTALAASQMWTTVNSGDDITVAAGNLAYTGITATGNSVTFVGTGAEALTPFTSTTSGTIYASFLSNVTDISNITADLAFTYYALFTDVGGASTNARVWMRRNGTQYQYGLGTASTPTDWAPTLYNVGDTHYVVLGYDFAANRLSLFIDAPIGGSASPAVYVTLASPITTLGGFMLRQDASITTPTLVVDELSIKTTADFTLGTAGFNAISGLQVYPNPANDFLHITSTANAVRTVAIYDVIGKEVLNTTTSNEVINVSGLNAGIYMVKITEEGKTATRKLVIK